MCIRDRVKAAQAKQAESDYAARYTEESRNALAAALAADVSGKKYTQQGEVCLLYTSQSAERGVILYMGDNHTLLLCIARTEQNDFVANVFRQFAGDGML